MGPTAALSEALYHYESWEPPPFHIMPILSRIFPRSRASSSWPIRQLRLDNAKLFYPVPHCRIMYKRSSKQLNLVQAALLFEKLIYSATEMVVTNRGPIMVIPPIMYLHTSIRKQQVPSSFFSRYNMWVLVAARTHNRQTACMLSQTWKWIIWLFCPLSFMGHYSNS